jgi:hypothetical protein
MVILHAISVGIYRYCRPGASRDEQVTTAARALIGHQGHCLSGCLPRGLATSVELTQS